MNILPIHTPVIMPGTDLPSLFHAGCTLQDGDIIVVSSKAVATAEGFIIDLSSLTPSAEAAEWAQKTKRSPAFMEAVLQETARLNGTVTGYCPGALLTELRPTGLMCGTIFAPNAGMDESNMELQHAAGWPMDPVQSARNLKEGLKLQCAVIIGDSCCRPRRLGVTAFALTACGIDPLKSEIGSTDLYGRTMRVTVEALADQLTTAANCVMGNANQSIPAAIIRDHDIPFTDFCGWVDGIEPKEDLFGGMI